MIEEIKEYYIKVLRSYAVFSGRASRKEYWYFFLANFLVGAFFGIISSAGDMVAVLASLASSIYALAIVVPALAVSVRRLHDTGHSGWWLLLGFVPIVGPLVILIFMVLEGEAGSNQYGHPSQSIDLSQKEHTDVPIEED